jgi:hypothetical protein
MWGGCLTDKVAIIGAGWYGCHIARALKQAGYSVTIFEKNTDIFRQISGNFGIRLHAGPHYPRSQATRASCRTGFTLFQKEYKELLIPHQYSIYALGKRDADDAPSRVTVEEFKKVCEESASFREIKPAEWGYTDNVLAAFDIDEPSIAVGARLREAFRQYLDDEQIPVICKYNVKKILKVGGKFRITNGESHEDFDHVINATSYQSFIPKISGFSLDMEVVYQPCLALIYLDQKPEALPVSFIVMDGFFPCLMPYQDTRHDDGKLDNTYILTHGKWTILGSYAQPEQAQQALKSLPEMLVKNTIRLCSEKAMMQFWPEFCDRFKFVGWKGTVLAKMRTGPGFRGSVTFANKGIIHVFPGKINNVYDAEREVLQLLQNEDVLQKDDYQYVRGGVLDLSLHEIVEKPRPGDQDTCSLQTLADLTHGAMISGCSSRLFASKFPGGYEPSSSESPSLVNI